MTPMLVIEDSPEKIVLTTKAPEDRQVSPLSWEGCCLRPVLQATIFFTALIGATWIIMTFIVVSDKWIFPFKIR